MLIQTVNKWYTIENGIPSEALKSERLTFQNKGQDTTEYDIAIEYLETGFNPYSEYQYELLDLVINDFNSICSVYGC